MKTLSSQIPEKSIAEIRQLHTDVIAAATMALTNATRIGELLTTIKASMQHGSWLPWVNANLPFSERTARRYIACFENRDRIKSANVTDLADAYRLMSPPAVAGDRRDDGDDLMIIEAVEYIFKERGWDYTAADVIGLWKSLCNSK